MDYSERGRNIYFKMLDMIRQNRSCVLCTVIGTQGSTPQKSGSSALFGEKGIILGTIGGGVVELAIQEKAREALQTSQSGHFLFDLENDISNEDAAICGGVMSILLDATPEEHFSLFAEIQDDINNGNSGVLITSVKTTKEDQTEIQRMWATRRDLKNGLFGLKGTIAEAVNEMLLNTMQDDFREFLVKGTEVEEKRVVLLESILPLPKLLIAGAGHVGKALSQISKLLDFEVFVWDERKEFANKKNLPYADKIFAGKMNRKPRNLKVDKYTFIVIATSGHKNDADVLKLFIGTGAGYIGMIGSKKKTALVKKKFLEEGWATQKQWDTIHTPIGLDIHSKTVPEIAVSIAAQLIKVRYELNSNE